MYYWLKMNGKKKNSTVTFQKHAFNLKECKTMINYYTKRGYDVHVNRFKLLEITTYKKKIPEYIETDSYMYKGRIKER